MTGTSLTISGYYGVGGGISLPVNSKYEGLVKILITGVGTPQVGIEGSNSSNTIDKAEKIYNQAIENKYGSD